ncbi:tail sheath protein [Spirochaetia bacterium]|nr:tail sheath protein [Spirochaetia bacterium]
MGVQASAVSRVTGVEVSFKNFNIGRAQKLPQRVAIIGVGNDDADYSLDKFEIEGNASDVGDRYGYGSPLHLAALQFYPQIGKTAEFPVTCYPLAKANGSAPAEGAIEAYGTAEKNGSGQVTIGGQKALFVIPKGTNAETALETIKNAINSVLNMPVRTGTVSDDSLSLISKWSGDSSNRIKIKIKANVPGITFSITGMADGALDPEVSPGLQKIGIVWETQVLNTLDYADQDRLDTYQLWAEGRRGPEEKKMVCVCHGCTDPLAVRTAITNIREYDSSNYFIVSVNSDELPFVVAAKGMVDDVVTTANRNPACGYKGRLTGLHCGDDDQQENFTQRNSSVNKGSSTNLKTGNVAELCDIITFYHPGNEGKFPSYRYVVDMVKLQNIVFNVRLIMEAEELKGAPLVPDNTPTSNPAAVSPKVIKGWFINLANSLADEALISDPEFTKRNLKVWIDTENPKRVNVLFPVKLSGNVEISSTDVYFGFYLGDAAAA